MTAISAQTRRIIHDRDQGLCLRCGGRGTNIQHRIGRGMGGTKRPVVNSVAALVTMCGSGTTGCHGYVTSHPAEAFATGWAISRTNPDQPYQIPLIDLRGAMFFLTEEAEIRYVSPNHFFPTDPAEIVSPS